jgi:hypothetical protein
MRKCPWFSGLIGLLAIPAANATLTMNITYDSSVTSSTNSAQIQTAFAYAAQIFSSHFTNAATINLTVYWGPVGPFSGGVSLGASSTSLVGSGGFLYPNLTNALRGARCSADDSNSVVSLPASDPTTGPWFLPRAEAKVLNVLVSPTDPAVDGQISFATNVSYTFDPTNRAVSGKFDFIGVATHEISETMGRLVGLKLNGTFYVPYDLFRFTNNGARSFNTAATNAYFSVDNGATVLKLFYTNSNFGDIQDWLSGSTPDACDALASTGKKLAISAVDFQALDVIGYNAPPVKASQVTGKKLANGTFLVAFTNIPGSFFTVLAATNVTLPLTNWTGLGSASETNFGQYQFIDTGTTTNKLRFYDVRSP